MMIISTEKLRLRKILINFDAYMKINRTALDIGVYSNVILSIKGGGMEMHLSVSEVSETLGISKDTLRYYDRLELVSPNRGNNQYRYYSESNILDLQYIEVMKYVGFTLKDIKKILSNMRNCSGQDLENIKVLVSYQADRIKQSIQVYKNIMELMSEAEKLLINKESPIHSLQIQKLVQQVFADLKRNDERKIYENSDSKW